MDLLYEWKRVLVKDKKSKHNLEHKCWSVPMHAATDKIFSVSQYFSLNVEHAILHEPMGYQPLNLVSHYVSFAVLIMKTGEIGHLKVVFLSLSRLLLILIPLWVVW